MNTVWNVKIPSNCNSIPNNTNLYTTEETDIDFEFVNSTITTMPVKPNSYVETPECVSAIRNANVPDNFTWRTFGQDQVEQISRNQYNCGGCWAFAIASALTDRIALIHEIKAPMISSSYIISLGSKILQNFNKGSNPGCLGNNVFLACQYLGEYQVPLKLESCWPFSLIQDNKNYGGPGIINVNNQMMLPTPSNLTKYKNCCINCCDASITDKNSFNLFIYPQIDDSNEVKIKYFGLNLTSFNITNNQNPYTQDNIELVIKDIQLNILTDGPVITSIRVYKDFMDYWKNDAPKGAIYNRDINSPFNGGHACCCPDTDIITSRGIIKIPKIEEGDEVLTSKGFKKVKATMERYVEEDVYILKTRFWIEPLKITGNHPVLVKKCSKNTKIQLLNMSNLDWVEASNIKEGYFLVSRIDDTVIPSKMTSLFARLLGYYIGDGNLLMEYKNGRLKSGKFRLTYHRYNKQELVNDLIECVKEYDNTINHSIYTAKNENTNIITFYSTKLAKLIAEYCGTAKNKFISNEILFLEPEKQLEFILGWYRTDGNGEWLKKSSIFTAEKNLAVALIFILQRCKLVYSFYKINPQIRIIKGKEANTKGGFVINFNNLRKNTQIHYDKQENLIFTRIMNIKKQKYEGNVYNLEVDGVNEYHANNTIVHNCSITGWGIDKTTGNRYWEVKNSWGNGGWNNGYFKVPFSTLDNQHQWIGVDVPIYNNGIWDCGVISILPKPLQDIDKYISSGIVKKSSAGNLLTKSRALISDFSDVINKCMNFREYEINAYKKTLNKPDELQLDANNSNNKSKSNNNSKLWIIIIITVILILIIILIIWYNFYYNTVEKIEY